MIPDMTRLSKSLAVLALVAAAGQATGQTRDAILLTLQGAADDTLYQRVTDAGVAVGERLGGDTWFASVPEGGLDRLQGVLGDVVRLEPVPSDVKTRGLPLEPDGSVDAEGPVRLLVVPAQGSADEAIGAALDTMAGEVDLTVIDRNTQKGWVVEIAASDVGALAAEPFVALLYTIAEPPLLD